jgi:SPP1 family phage portal protein
VTIDVKAITTLISKDSARQTKLAEQCEYAGGEHLAILGRRPHEEPDNRIPVPIARKGVRFVSGYMVKPGNIVYSTDDDEPVEPQGAIGKVVAKVKTALVGKAEPANYAEDILQPIFDDNDEQLTTQEEFETCLVHGEAWEYHYTRAGTACFVEIPVVQCIPLWSDDMPPKLDGMIRYYKASDETYQAYFYDEASIRHFSGPSYEAMTEVLEDAEDHGFQEVPFVRFRMSRDSSNLFDCVIPLVDFFDRIVSEDYANESQRFASSYLLLKNRLSNELDDLGMNEVDKIRITRTFEDLGDDVTKSVAFLSKTIPVDFIKNVADTFERLIYDMMQIINPNDIATTGQISGIALAYKLLQFEYLCASIEAYFSRGLQSRIRLIQNVSSSMSAQEMDRADVDIQFRRNLPFDMASAVDQFSKVVGVLPDEIALKLFPASFITDPKAVAEEMAKNRSAAVPDITVPPTPEEQAAMAARAAAMEKDKQAVSE